jgi:hypothetical protein
MFKPPALRKCPLFNQTSRYHSGGSIMCWAPPVISSHIMHVVCPWCVGVAGRHVLAHATLHKRRWRRFILSQVCRMFMWLAMSHEEWFSVSPAH